MNSSRGSSLASPVSFRDPAGTLFLAGGRVIRRVRAPAAAILRELLSSAALVDDLRDGRVIATRELSREEALELAPDAAPDETLFEHEAVWFPSFPFEWPPEMLHAAGALTLKLARSVLEKGYGLKDATPYNVLFRGSQPVFVDLLSFERRQAGDAIWLAAAQFERTFLLPLLVHRRLGIPLDMLFLARRDGLEPEEAARWLPLWRRLGPPAFSLVTMPAWLGSRAAKDEHRLYEQRLYKDPEKARFVLDWQLRRLERQLARVAPDRARRSAWSEYLTADCHYSPEQFQRKRDFVEDVLRECAPRAVLDVGCNTGMFSELSARLGASVVSIDTDPVAIGRLWRHAFAERLEILPLVVNLARPSPGVGWQNGECPSFLDRARGRFDLVLVLALLHHLLVTERIPLERILDLLADLTKDAVILEFVGPDDAMFRRLLRGRAELHRDYCRQSFETACLRRFHIARRQPLEGLARCLYVLRKRW